MSVRNHRSHIGTVLGLTVAIAVAPYPAAFGQPAPPLPAPLETPTPSDSAPVEGSLPPLPATSPTGSRTSSTPTKIPGLVFGCIAVAAAGVGAGFGVSAVEAKNDFDRDPMGRNADRAERRMLGADLAIGVALVAAVTSVVLLVRRNKSPVREVGVIRF